MERLELSPNELRHWISEFVNPNIDNNYTQEKINRVKALIFNAGLVTPSAMGSDKEKSSIEGDKEYESRMLSLMEDFVSYELVVENGYYQLPIGLDNQDLALNRFFYFLDQYLKEFDLSVISHQSYNKMKLEVFTLG